MSRTLYDDDGRPIGFACSRGSRREAEPVEFEDVVCKAETERAILVVIDGEDVWMPKSQVHDDSAVFDAGEHANGKLVVTEWIAREKGLI